jgi:hypothetical protein
MVREELDVERGRICGRRWLGAENVPQDLEWRPRPDGSDGLLQMSELPACETVDAPSDVVMTARVR